MRQLGLLRKRPATEVNMLLASALNETEVLLEKVILGNAPKEASQAPALPINPAQVESGQITGHLPTPSASTGWQLVGVISSLSRASGTPSPSVSRLTPLESTGTPAGVCSWSNWSVIPSPSVSGNTGLGKRDR